ncbi:hypothetical protein [Streptomyces platensis]|nr:hypothetical protein [Streptomyces platensis]WUB84294.1 hypothetical protein OG424_36970 [Streptomyces platensis]
MTSSRSSMMLLLNDLQQREPTDKGFDQLVRELRTEVLAHVDDEENSSRP